MLLISSNFDAPTAREGFPELRGRGKEVIAEDRVGYRDI